MKTIFHIIIFCLAFTFNTGCEKADIQKAAINSQEQIQNRDVPDDCEDCPMTDCCCAVQFLEGDPVTLWLCGTTTGLTNIECGPTMPGNCNEIEGFILPLVLSPTNQYGYFCVAENTSFYIQNRNTSGNPTKIRVSCQAGQIGPQSDDVILGLGNTAFYTCNGDCEIALCN